MADWDSDEPLGYGRPPPWKQFRKGQSGNPKGRPKKKRDPEPERLSEQDAILRKEIDRKITITEGGERKEISIQEAVTKAQTAQALKGSPIAQRDVLNRIDRLETAEEKERKTRDEAEREALIAKVQSDERFFEYIVQVKKSQLNAWAQAHAAGKDEPDFPWPHPDDISIDEARKQYRLRGPFSSEEVPLYRFMRAERDAALARKVECGIADCAGAASWMQAWSLLMNWYDAKLPLRWQMGDKWEVEVSRLLFLTDRQLRKEIDRRAGEAEKWRQIAKVERDSESYRIVNEAFWPIFDAGGYRSLAHFEEAYEATGGKPPWPRKRKQPERMG